MRTRGAASDRIVSADVVQLIELVHVGRGDSVNTPGLVPDRCQIISEARSLINTINKVFAS